MNTRNLFGLVTLSLSLAVIYPGCSASSSSPGMASMQPVTLDSRYLSSGTLILSHKIPERDQSPASDMAVAENSQSKLLAPLIGYFPPGFAYLPADNETWLEISRESKMVVLHKGNALIKEIQGEGSVDLKPGEYYLQHPQKDPLWYATDDYFKKRRLTVPPDGNRLRYRRGALGKYALYITTTFPIHCGPVWVEDVGGLRVSQADLSSIYYMLPRGTPIIVK